MCDNVAIRSASSGTEHIFLDINRRTKSSPMCLTMRKAVSIHSAFYIVYWGMVYRVQGEQTDG